METSQPRKVVVQGIRDQLPILLGVIPFGLIFGALAIGQGIPPLAAQGFSLIIFAGSAQFIAAGLVGTGAPVVVILATIFIVNLRHALYSASLAPHLRQLSWLWRASLGWLLTDEAFATTVSHLARRGRSNLHWYLFGTGMTLWTSWQISTAAGILLGATIPTSWNLDFALPLTFLALIVPTLTNRPAWAAAATAGLAALLLHSLPFRLGLLLSAILGMVVGLWLDTRQKGSGT
jgi:4-azaleucine resistance transporter AzlC